MMAYSQKFGHGIPDDFSLHLKDPYSEQEFVETIYKAIENNQPFPDEGIFFD